MSVLVGAMIQCDQIARLFFNIWPFTSRKICQKVYKICQSSFKFLPNRKIGQDFEDFAKVWSHWTHPALPQKMFNALLRSSPVFARITWHSLFKRRTGGGACFVLCSAAVSHPSRRDFLSQEFVSLRKIGLLRRAWLQKHIVRSIDNVELQQQLVCLFSLLHFYFNTGLFSPISCRLNTTEQFCNKQSSGRIRTHHLLLVSLLL